MSIRLYYRRVTYQAGQGGIAKEGEVTIDLKMPPPMFSGAVEVEFGEIHPGQAAYTPFVRERTIDSRRSMEPPELIALKMWLMGFWRAAMREARKIPKAKERRKPLKDIA